MEERVAGTGDLGDGQMIEVTVGERKVLLAKVHGEFYATAARCPHWGGPLPEGTLSGPRLLCPWHKATYDVRDGRLLEPPALDGIGTYPVRVDGDDVYVNDEKRPPAGNERGGRDPADQRLFVVVGAGAAAEAAVEELRRSGYGGRLVVTAPEGRWPYDRPNLSKDYLAGELEAEWLPLRPPEFYDELGIERLDARVTALDAGTRRVTLDDGAELAPDAVLIASGGEPRRLQAPGADLPGVLTLRSWDDAERLMDLAEEAPRVVVVGASFIGMEAAASLRTRGLEVTVTAPDRVPFVDALGESVGEVVQALHEEHGVRFALGRKVTAVKGDGSVRAVELDDGTSLPCELVLVGIGVRPATGFVGGLALDEDGGVPVDQRLRAADGVWAAGDVARYREPSTGRDLRIEHWRLAEQHGRAAGRSMAGDAEPFAGVPFFWTQHFDLQLGYAGPGRGWDRQVVLGDLSGRDFLVFYAAGEQVLAACGTRDRELGAFMELMRLGRLPSADELQAGGDVSLSDRLGSV